MQTIVLARIENTGLKFTGKFIRPDGVNWREDYKLTPEPKALIWLNEGNESDLEKAKKFAKEENYSVFTFPTTEKDPLGLAKKQIMQENGLTE